MIGHIKEIYDRKGSTFDEKMLTRKELKQQFKTYESHKSLLRKVTYESHKVKKDKKDHRSGDKLHNRTDN